ncbi:membrane-bound lytic murein transglycosylase MltF [Sulfurivermis fontis]|uniref:membrane-bound lytic murein transglycosylase MltF n=1 Tax=Sulfurivermis fontis TaxID=1972068 RepID=UPI000FDB237E|nr:membrane-bound lytic murein transglycosylase MltF [Sulfurivermis fontis]
MPRQRRRYTAALGGLFLLQLIGGCSQPRNELEQVLHTGELVVITTNAATTYYEGPDGPTGMEYDLVRGFADELGVRLRLVVAGNVGEVLRQLAEGKAHFAAAGLTVTEPRRQWLRFTPPYQEITQQLVYRRGTPRPSSLENMEGHLEVLAASSHAEHLTRLKGTHPQLKWTENTDLGSEELLSLLHEGLIDYTVSDSHEVAINQRFLPELRVAFDLTEPEPLAWAFPRFRDGSLHQAATAYFERLHETGQLARLREKHYGHVNDFDYVETRTFMRHIEQRLPQFRAQFEAAGNEHNMDWRLLAAMAYQESHWNPRAVSPTGVRGIMMLTQITARDLGVERRTDPSQSIAGGSRYFKSLLDRLPERIQGRDRLWLALAAYNIGYGHLEDARVITQQRGGDPDKWMDVKENLPLLHKRKWYSQTRYGYARGNEAVRYVENIRSYYDILAWSIERNTPKPPPVTLPAALLLANPAL